MEGEGRWGARGGNGGRGGGKRVMLTGGKEDEDIDLGAQWELVCKVRRMCCQRPQ